MNGYVIDSSMLQSDALRRLLERGDSIAILPDFGWFELYKQQSIEALRLGLSVIGDHADKVVLLRPGGQIARLHPAVAEQTEFLILEGRNGDIREMTQIVRAPGPLPDNAAVQLQALWAWARTLRPSLMEGASEISCQDR